MKFNPETIDIAELPREEKVRSLRMESITSQEQFDAIAPKWNRLTKEAPSTIYQTFGWLSTWWNFFGNDQRRKLHIITFCNHEMELVGLAPMFEERVTVAGIPLHTSLRMLGCGEAFGISGGMFLDDGPSDFLDWIVHPEYEKEIADAFVASWIKGPVAERIEFVNARPDSYIVRILLPSLHGHGIAARSVRADICSSMPIPDRIEEYIGSRDSHLRRRLTRALKTLNSGNGQNGITIVDATSEAEFTDGFDALVALHQQRWNALGYAGTFFTSQMRGFQRSAAETLNAGGYLWLKIVRASGTAVAARLGYCFKGKMYDYLSGFDDESASAKERPGFALLLSMAIDGRSNGSTWLELLRGDEPYKFEMTSTTFHNQNSILFHPSSARKAGRLGYRVLANLRLGYFLLMREVLLIRVHFVTHGIVTFMYHYTAFRFNRAVRKIRSSIPSTHQESK